MRRRDFLGGVAIAGTCWPHHTQAQQRPLLTVGFVFTGSSSAAEPLLIEFRRGLAEHGNIEGRNITIEYRWGMGEYEKLPSLVAELIGKNVTVIAPSAPPAALAAKAATQEIPIVFAVGDDPVRLGLVNSLSRPRGNVTGASYFATALEAKRIELLRVMVPHAKVLGVLVNKNFPGTTNQLNEIEHAARSVGLAVAIVYASNSDQIGEAFSLLGSKKVDAVLVGADPFFFSRRAQIVGLAARHALPTIYQLKEFVAAGGLMSYGSIIRQAYREQGAYVGRILKGEKPSDLPIVLATKFELVINSSTAKALNLAVPDRLLAIADEVTE